MLIYRKYLNNIGYYLALSSSLVSLPIGFIILCMYPIITNTSLLILFFSCLRGLQGMHAPWIDVLAGIWIIYFWRNQYRQNPNNRINNDLSLAAIFTIAFSFIVGLINTNADYFYLLQRFTFGVIYIQGASILLRSNKNKIGTYLLTITYFQAFIVLAQFLFGPGIFSTAILVEKIADSRQLSNLDAIGGLTLFRTLGSFVNPNQLAEYMLILIATTNIFAKYISDKDFKLCTTMQIVLIVTTLSRASLISLVFAYILILIYMGFQSYHTLKNNFVRIFKIKIVIPSIVFIAIVLSQSRLNNELLTNLFRIGSIDLLGQRNDIYSFIWTNLFNIENFIFGIGFEGWSKVLDTYDLTSQHNIFLEILIGNGIPGMVYISYVLFILINSLSKLLQYPVINYKMVFATNLVLSIILIRGSFASVSLYDWNYSTMIILWLILEIESHTKNEMNNCRNNITTEEDSKIDS